MKIKIYKKRQNGRCELVASIKNHISVEKISRDTLALIVDKTELILKRVEHQYEFRNGVTTYRVRFGLLSRLYVNHVMKGGIAYDYD